MHANSYYSLDISYFKSSLDAGLLDHLWGKYWVNTLASSPLLATRDLTAGQMRDIGASFPWRAVCSQQAGCTTETPVTWRACKALYQQKYQGG